MIYAFDFFGVVVKWGSEAVYPLWDKHCGIASGEFKKRSVTEFKLCETGKISSKEFWQRLGKKFNVPPKELENILRERFHKVAKLDKEVVKIINSLDKKVLFSNQLPLHAVESKKNGWFEFFDKLFLSFKIGAKKPDLKSYKAVLEKLKAKPSDVVFFDDKLVNVEGARKAGINAVLFKNAKQLRAEVAKYG